MRLLAVAVLLVVAPPSLTAADKDEDKAKEASLAFLKAIKAKDVDAAMKLSGVPFLIEPEGGGSPTLIEKAEDLKANIAKKLEKLKDPGNVPSEVKEVLDLAAIRKKSDGKADAEMLKLIEKAFGEKGFGVLVGGEGSVRGGLLIRIKDGKALVVGVIG